MNKKNDKRLCWNCEGNVSHHLTQCPYCGVDLTQPADREENSLFQGFGNPFQSANQQEIPQPPYARTQDFNITKEEWNSALNKEQEQTKEEDVSPATKRELIALLLLLPGIVFLLFGLALFLFSTEGVLTLQWNQNFAYFYVLGAVPLIYIGWRAIKTSR